MGIHQPDQAACGSVLPEAVDGQQLPEQLRALTKCTRLRQ
jgi:hypothetical protein